MHQAVGRLIKYRNRLCDQCLIWGQTVRTCHEEYVARHTGLKAKCMNPNKHEVGCSKF